MRVPRWRSIAPSCTRNSRSSPAPFPSSGEKLPVVGLGSSATFSQVARSEDVSALREVLKAFTDQGGTVFDTAPSYGASEEVAGRLGGELGISSKIFWATKVNVAPRGGGAADIAAARAQIEASFTKLKKPKIDLIQVHNLGRRHDPAGPAQGHEEGGRVRYIGVTSTNKSQYAELQTVMRNEPLDFIGVDYAIDNRDVEESILPLAQERKIGVLVYVPFGRTRLFTRVGQRPVPDWAAQIDAKTWAQVFLKYVIAHPAVTVVTPATSKPANVIDNLAGGRGRLPDEATRKKMVEFIEALPSA